MTEIDATKRLTIRHFKKFDTLVSDEETIMLTLNDVTLSTINKSNVKDVFQSQIFDSASDDDRISFTASNARLTIKGSDYKKWMTPWWSDRIFRHDDDTDTEKAVMTVTHCSILKLHEDETTTVKSIVTSSKKELVRFINQYYGRMKINADVTDSVVKLKFWKDDDEQNAVTKTFDEFVADGTFVVE